jgi:tetratricopeptide (TPR) repeat protein
MRNTINELQDFLAQQDESYGRGQYREILDTAQARYGKYQNWDEPLLSRLASRCLTHMGLDRTADAIIYHAWRRHPNHPQLAVVYLGMIKRRRGALIAWQLSKQLLTLDLDDEQRADLLIEQADIAITFRDYAFAKKAIKQAGELSNELWVKYNQGYLLFCQDRYNEAQEVLESVLLIRPDYRPSRQLLAHILLLKGQHDQAIIKLYDIAKTMQSVSLIQQLLYLYIEIKDYTQAWQCMEQLEATFYQKPQYAIRQINYIKADLLCAQQRYEEALPYFEQKNFYHSKIAESIKSNVENSDRRVLDVPFVRQYHMTCAPASITAVAGYWGVKLEQERVIEDICYDGTPAVDERHWVESQGWVAIEFELQYETLKQLIDLDMPVLLATVEPGSAHLQIIVGYDNKLGVYILRDPYHPRLQEMLVEESHRYYASSGPRCMLMLPQAKVDEVSNIHFEAASLYDGYYQLTKALDKNNRKRAYNAYRTMLERDADHRLTLSAQRNLAIYDNDEPLTLTVTEKLLERFPDDVNLQLSKTASMAYMGSYRHTLYYLENLCEKPMADFLIRSRLAQELANDQRQQKRTKKLLRGLLSERPTDVSTLKVYADYLWSMSEFNQSYELYRFITCLEDKVEEYAAAYFKAARYFKETDVALRFLMDRFNRFTAHSYGPAISLFNALDSLNRTTEGLEYLEKAIELRPDDGFLMLFAARQYYYINQMQRSHQLMEKAQPVVNRLRYAEMAAEICEYQNKRNEAIRHWQTILDYEPLNQTANHALVRLLNESGQELLAKNHINEQLKNYPGNYSLLRLQIHWCDAGELQQLETFYNQLIVSHPDDNWAYKNLAHSLLQQYHFEDALELALEAVKIGSNDADAYCCLGDVYEAKAEYTKAIAAYRNAIQISCDAIEAFEPLLRCASTRKDKKKELQFIYDELIKQVTFGEAILEFQKIARRWYTTEELLKFLDFAVSERPDLWQSWVSLSVEKRELDLLDDAHGIIDEALKKFPLIPRLYLEKAEIFFYQHLLSEAEVWLKKALTLSPGWSAAVTRLSVVLEYQNKKVEAVELLQQLINKSPYTVAAYGYLSDLLWHCGSKQQAIETLMKVLEFTPLYRWAWERLNTMCREIDRVRQVIERIEIQREKMPDNAELVQIHANMVDDTAQKRVLLEEFLGRHPTAIGPSVDLIHSLADQGEYEAAMAVCSHDRWGEKIPVAIRANQAWIHYCMGNISDAITSMNNVVHSDPNYYDGWRYLTIWYDELNDSEHVLQCVKECNRLYPNDANVLCFVAEHLQKHAPGEKEQASGLIKRAFYLDPTDRYVGLTYIDDLLKHELIDQASKALETLKRHVDDVYVTSRELSYACKAGQREVAMQHWQRLITDPDVNDALVSFGWGLLSDTELLGDACQIIEQQRRVDFDNNQAHLSEFCGEYWVQYQINEKGVGNVTKTLRNMTARDEFDDRVFEGLLRHLISEEIGAPTIFIKKHYQRLQQDRTNWGLVAYLYAVSAKWYEVVEWLKEGYQRDDAETWVIYFYGLAFRQITEWDAGVHMTEYALSLPRDNYYDELMIWYVFDCYIKGDTAISREQLYNDINIKELSHLARFILSLNECLMCLQGRGFVEAYEDISPILRQCQRDFLPITGHVAANIARQKTRDLLEDSIQGSLINKLTWKWRLSNHF